MCVADVLLLKAFDVVKPALNKHELRSLMRKFRFADEKIKELETTYHGKSMLAERVYRVLLHWQQTTDANASIDALIHTLHIMGIEALAQKLTELKICAHAPRL